ncbi:hypothetical protein SCHPADRAFT_909048 [Schizopora paradoxa]|uniref:Uncharacterized protein n=1 Tax=Schizopora paradoxa TaxID=27342 RepID=A0A0H2RSX1_9AGAM|nr:hypothetical protein SCHPADRAFT_909048 [Schizopora paradoxa]
MAQNDVGGIDRDTIRVLKKILLDADKLQGLVEDEECWTLSADGVFAPRILGENLNEGYWTLQHSLIGIEKIAGFIRCGFQTCKKYRMEKRPCHVLVLPEEILATILHYACQIDIPQSGTRFTSASVTSATTNLLSLSAVCRRFRNFLLNSPSEWGIWQHMDTRALELFQERSQDRPLLAYININHVCKARNELRKKAPQDFAREHARLLAQDNAVESILQHRDRFRTLAVRLSAREQGAFSYALPELAQTSPGQVHFPLLEELSIAYTDTEFPHQIRFCDTWVMPQLRSFSIANDIPKGAFRTALGTSLVSLQLIFNRSTHLDLPGLIDLLDSQPSLIDLSLQVKYIRSMPIAGQTSQLPSLQNFCLHLDAGPKGSVSARNLLNCLVMPILQSFKFSIDSTKGGKIQELIEDTMESNARFREIQNFDLQIFAKDALGIIDIGPAFSQLLTVRNLSITTPNFSRNVSSFDISQTTALPASAPLEDADEHLVNLLPPLESLRLCGNAFSPKFIRNLHARYADQEVHLALDSLVLKNCGSFDDDIETLYELVPADKVVWLDTLKKP